MLPRCSARSKPYHEPSSFTVTSEDRWIPRAGTHTRRWLSRHELVACAGAWRFSPRRIRTPIFKTARPGDARFLVEIWPTRLHADESGASSARPTADDARRSRSGPAANLAVQYTHVCAARAVVSSDAAHGDTTARARRRLRPRPVPHGEHPGEDRFVDSSAAAARGYFVPKDRRRAGAAAASRHRGARLAADWTTRSTVASASSRGSRGSSRGITCGGRGHVRAHGHTVPAGSYFVSTAQPLGAWCSRSSAGGWGSRGGDARPAAGTEFGTYSGLIYGRRRQRVPGVASVRAPLVAMRYFTVSSEER